MRVPSRTWYDPVIDAVLHTGEDALEKARNWHIYNGMDLAVDIETPGLDRQFEVNCLTAAWRDDGRCGGDGRVHALLLDPARDEEQRLAAGWAMMYAGRLILHNACFDMPALHHLDMIKHSHTRAGLYKTVDTLVLARLAYPDTKVGKRLEDLAPKLLGWPDHKGGMEKAGKSAGHKNKQATYGNLDIDSPVYRFGAMADTVATLLLEPILREQCITQLTAHPFVKYGATTRGEAEAIIAEQEKVNRVMLSRTVRGINVDRDYLTRYLEAVDLDYKRAESTLAQHGLTGGRGKGAAVLEYLKEIGELPPFWPRTPKTNALRATKDLMEAFEHPLVAAQRTVADTDHLLQYLNQVDAQSRVTGRCHPQVGILGASATGRMSASSPPYQQFPALARPIFIDDGQGMTSIDWSSIEPVVMGLMAKDQKFLAPFEAGKDLYEPIALACAVERAIAKIVLLALMYGQGDKAMALRIGHTAESAAQLRRDFLNQMPGCKKWMGQVDTIAETYGMTLTARGRVLPVDKGFGYKAINFTIQGSAYDMLAYTICEMYDQGISEHVQLAMHDEVVVDTEVAEAVREIMVKPPDWLITWAERVPILRTDMADIGHAWAKV